MKIKLFGLLSFFVFFLIFNGCKKNVNNSGQPVNTDSSLDISFGLDTNFSKVSFAGITAVEDLDSSKIPGFTTFGSADLPSKYIIDVPPPDVKGQRGLNDCVGWAVGYGLMGYYYNAINNNSFSVQDSNFSPLYIWNQVNGGKNKGVGIPDALNQAKLTGCSRWKYMSPDEYTYNSPIPAVATQNAANYLISEWHYMKRLNMDVIKSFVAKNYPILVGLNIYKNFSKKSTCTSCVNVKPDGRQVYVKSDGEFIGAHAMLICGYDDNIQAFKLLNSWGTNYGNDGYYWIDYDYFKQIVITSFLDDDKNFPVDNVFLAFPSAVITLQATDIAAGYATLNGFVVTDQNRPIIEEGICYSTNANPTINDSKEKASIAALGKFSVNISNLISNTTYHARAYATNANGVVYGNDINFVSGSDGDLYVKFTIDGEQKIYMKQIFAVYDTSLHADHVYSFGATGFKNDTGYEYLQVSIFDSIPIGVGVTYHDSAFHFTRYEPEIRLGDQQHHAYWSAYGVDGECKLVITMMDKNGVAGTFEGIVGDTGPPGGTKKITNGTFHLPLQYH